MWRDNCGLGKLAHSFWEKVELKLPLKGKMGFRKAGSHVMTDMSKGGGGAGYEMGLTRKKFLPGLIAIRSRQISPRGPIRWVTGILS